MGLRRDLLAGQLQHMEKPTTSMAPHHFHGSPLPLTSTPI